MEELGRNVRVIESPKDVEINKYVVAMKTSTMPVPIEGYSVADYHFAVEECVE